MSHITIDAHDTEEILRQKLKQSTDEAYKTRLKAIILVIQGNTRYEIVERLTVNPGSVTTWLKRYNGRGTAGLVSNKGGRPKGPQKWDASLFADLATEIDKGGYWSVPRMQEWLTSTKKVNIPEQTVWYRMDKLNYSYKSARPHPVQGNREKQETFKRGVLRRSWSR